MSDNFGINTNYMYPNWGLQTQMPQFGFGQMPNYALMNYTTPNFNYNYPIPDYTSMLNPAMMNPMMNNMGYGFDTFNYMNPTTPNFTPTSIPTNEQTQSEEKEEKSGLSTGAKVGIGAVVLTGLGVATYFLTKGHFKGIHNTGAFKELVFKNADNLKDAEKFAKKKLGVTYNGIDDVDGVNFINEWLTGLYNKSKGKIDHTTYPKFIGDSDLGKFGLASMCDGKLDHNGITGHVMGINMPLLKDFGKYLDDIIGDGSIICKTTDGKFKIADDAYDTPFVQKLVERMNSYNANTTTFREKIRIFSDLKGIEDGQVIDGKLKEVVYSDYYFLNHELGHMRHQNSATDYNLMKKVEEFTESGEEVSNITNEFLNTQAIQETAQKVSNYAKESPCEFVAEVFAQLLEGKTLPDDVMQLYKKYNGPLV